MSEPTSNAHVVPADIPVTDVVRVQHGMYNGSTSGYGNLQRVITMPSPSQPPYPEPYATWIDLINAGATRAGVPVAAVATVVVDRDELAVRVDREQLLSVLQFLRDDATLRYELCSSVSGVHYPVDAGRELHVAYHLLSITHNRRLRIETTCPDADPHVPSAVAVYPTADWQERETWDFFGVIFDGHPALTRIEMPDDWKGHPQRKDYPLGGIDVEYRGARIPAPDRRGI